MKMTRFGYCITSNFPPVLFLFFILAGCTSETTSKAELETQDQVLIIANGTEPQDLDPHVITGFPEIRLMHALFEGLVARDPETLEIIPAIAESWEISEDGLTYTFNLRDDAKWSNGDPVTVEDFYYSWRRILHPSIASENAYNYYPIKNAEEYNNGEIEDFSQVGIATKNNQLIFHLKEVSPLFLDWLSKSTSFPVHQATIEKHGKIGERGTAWTRAENMVSNGPFVLDEWSTHKIIKVKKNLEYWDKETIKLNEMHFLPIESQVTEERMFRNGTIHLTTGTSIQPEKIAWYKENMPDHLISSPIYATYYYKFNTTIKPLDDPRVRKALSISIDRKMIVDNVTKGGQKPAYSLNPDIPGGYTPEINLEPDIAKARQLLADAGYPNGQGFPELEILYNTLESHRQIALVIQQMWKNNLNINVTLNNQEWKVFLDSQTQLAYEIARSGGGADVADPSDFLNVYTSNSGMNDTGWSNSEYDKLVLQGKNISNRTERYHLFREAEIILINEMPIMPIYFYTRVSLKSPAVKNWKYNFLDYFSYKDVYLDL